MTWETASAMEGQAEPKGPRLTVEQRVALARETAKFEADFGAAYPNLADHPGLARAAERVLKAAEERGEPYDFTDPRVPT